MEAGVKLKANKSPIPIGKIIIYIFLIIYALFYIAPLLWILSVSVKTKQEVFASPFGLPEVWQWDNFKVAWINGRLGIATLNSLIVSSVTLAISMFVGAMAAFGITRMRWKLANAAMSYFLVGMMIPVHCVLIPLFVTASKVNLDNSLIGLMFPYVTFALPTVIFILSGFFRSLPNDIFESACIDGCSIYRVFFSIALPLAKTGFAVTGMMTFVATWNELLMAMVFISDHAKKTLPVTLTFFAGPHSTNYTQMFAAVVLAIVPTIIVYSIFSNQIVEGLTQGAIKG